MDPRLASLEATAGRLEREIAELRTEIRALRDSDSEQGGVAQPVVAEGPASTTDVPQARAKPLPRARSWEELFGRLGVAPADGTPGTPPRAHTERRGFEDLIGRYGTIALASLTILMGFGALIGWAIRNGFLGPTVRIGLGLTGAAVLAAFGLRVRRGDSPRFGNALLALALAVVHVVAWGAGPRLQLIATPWVLALAALASAVLAALAWREDDQALFNVGFGGALLAPFVTSSGSGDGVMLLTYGFIVLMAGIASLGQKTWTRAPLVVSAGIVLYAVTGETMLDGRSRWAEVNAPAAFALGLGMLAIVLLEGRKRANVGWPALVTALGVLVAVADSPANDDPQFVFAMLLVLAAMMAMDRERRGVRTALFGALIIPVGATATALGTLDDVTGPRGAVVAMMFAAMSAYAAWKDLGGERGTWSFTATGQAGLSLALASDEQSLAFAIAMAAFGVGCALMTQRLKQPGVGLAGTLWIIAATFVAFEMLNDRVDYAYRPFLTTASLAAAAISAAWVQLSWHTARNLRAGSTLGQDLPKTVIRLAGWVVAFLWVREELAGAISPDVSRFLLVAWYATSGVGAIFIGRARGLPMLRQAGLALAVFAALTAITQSSLLAIGWRVASYLLTGAFLLGVAWSYRITRGDAPTVPPEERQAA